MQITTTWLQEKSACDKGVAWLGKHFPEGGEYQAVLDRLAADGKENWAEWLLQKAGPLNTILDRVSGNPEISTHLFLAGSIKVFGFLRVTKTAGGGIEAGECGFWWIDQ